MRGVLLQLIPHFSMDRRLCSVFFALSGSGIFSAFLIPNFVYVFTSLPGRPLSLIYTEHRRGKSALLWILILFAASAFSLILTLIIPDRLY